MLCAAIKPPVLYISALHDNVSRSTAEMEDAARLRTRLQAFRNFHEVTVKDVGHMVHHDDPEESAAVMEDKWICLLLRYRLVP